MTGMHGNLQARVDPDSWPSSSQVGCQLAVPIGDVAAQLIRRVHTGFEPALEIPRLPGPRCCWAASMAVQRRRRASAMRLQESQRQSRTISDRRAKFFGNRPPRLADPPARYRSSSGGPFVIGWNADVAPASSHLHSLNADVKTSPEPQASLSHLPYRYERLGLSCASRWNIAGRGGDGRSGRHSPRPGAIPPCSSTFA
jgi:hypothetical protein